MNAKIVDMRRKPGRFQEPCCLANDGWNTKDQEKSMISPVAQPLPGTVLDPMYPDEDGRPMGDRDFHSAALVWLRQALEDFFAAIADVYVATNLIFYYQYGDPSARRDPDVLGARGVGKHFRRS